MYRLIHADCPRCRARFLAEAEKGEEHPPHGYRTRCPKCGLKFALGSQEGVLRPTSALKTVAAVPVFYSDL